MDSPQEFHPLGPGFAQSPDRKTREFGKRLIRQRELISDEEHLAAVLIAAAEEELAIRRCSRPATGKCARKHAAVYRQIDEDAFIDLRADVTCSVWGCLSNPSHPERVTHHGRLPADYVCNYFGKALYHACIERLNKSQRELLQGACTEPCTGLEEDVEDSREPPKYDFDEIALLKAALPELPAADQQLVVLLHFDGLSAAQVAVRLDLTPDCVRQRHFRAMTQLRELVQKSSS